MKKNNKGFSLVELIVVIAIMAILASVAVAGFSLYIPKAKMADDEQMINDIEYAFELGAHEYPNGVADYVVITTTGATAKEGGFADEALTATFGSDWRNELKLQYDNWASDSSVLRAALNAPDVSGSSYLTNSSISELLGNVQDVTSAAAGLLGSVMNKNENQYLFALESAMGEDYMERAVQAGVIGRTEDGQDYALLPGTYEVHKDENGKETITVTPELQNQLSNLMVFGVAGEMNSIPEEDMINLMTSSMGGEYDNTKYSPATVLAAQYAFYKAYALDSGTEAKEDFNDLNLAMDSAASVQDVQDALDEFLGKHAADIEAYATAEEGDDVVFSDSIRNNANAVSQIMSGVTSASPNYSNTDSLNNSNLFVSESVSNELNVFVGVALVTLNEEEKTALISVLQNNPNAVVVLINNGNIYSTVD